MGKALGDIGDAIADLGKIGATLVFGLAGFIIASTEPPALDSEGRATKFSYEIDAGLPIPFGRVAYAGDVNYRVAYDATNRLQSLFCTFAASGPIKSIISTAFDDEITTFDGTLNKALDGEHQSFMWFKALLGTQPQSALTSPTGSGAGIPAPGWTSDHKQSGRAVYCLTMIENSKFNEYPSGIVKPLITFEGVYGWDPRLDSTWPGGSGSCRLLEPSTWVWIDEGAIAALNWCIGRWEGASGGGLYGVPYACSVVAGLGASLDSIDVSSFINLANVADGNAWKVSAIPTSKDDKFEVLKRLLQASGGLPARKAGKISCVCISEAQASVVSVTATDVAGPVEISLGRSRLERRNAVIPRFLSEDHRWEMTPIAAVSNAAWVTEDGGKRARGLDLPFVPLADQAAALAYLDLAHDRERRTGAVTFKPHMRRVEPGDCFTFEEPGFLLDGVKVKCLKRSYDPATGLPRITFREETDAKYAAALGQTGDAPPPSDPETPPGPYVEPPTDFMAAFDTPDIKINYRNPNNSTFDFVNVLRTVDDTDETAATIMTFYGGGAGEYVPTISDLAPAAGHTYRYWLQAYDIYGNPSELVGPETVTL